MIGSRPLHASAGFSTHHQLIKPQIIASTNVAPISSTGSMSRQEKMIFWRPMRYPVIIVGLLFNIGLWTTVKIEFFGVMACFVAFLPLDRWEQAIGRRAARRRGRSTLEVPYDPSCPRCTGEVTAAVAADWPHELRPVAGRHLVPSDLADATGPARLNRAALDHTPAAPPHAPRTRDVTGVARERS